jgi:ABC-2 type transport system permease protein
MKAYLTIFWTELKLILRNFIVVFFCVIFPAGMVLLFGSMYGNDPIPQWGGYGMVDLSFGAYAGMCICVTGLMSLPLTLSQYRQKKVLKQFRATPVSPGSLLVSQVVVNFIFTIVSIVLLFLVSRICFGYAMRGSFWLFSVAFFIVSVCIFSIGMLIASIAPNERAATIICYLVYFPMLFLSGATVPYEMFPKGMQKFVQVLPLTHGIKMMKGISLGGQLSSYGTEITILCGVALVCAALSAVFFKWE